MQSILHFPFPVLPLTQAQPVPLDDRMAQAATFSGGVYGAPSSYNPPGALPLQWVGQPQGDTYANRQPVMLESEPLPGRRYIVSSLNIPLSVFVYSTQAAEIVGSALAALPQGEIGLRYRLYKNQELLSQQSEQYDLTQTSQGLVAQSPFTVHYQMTYATDIMTYEGDISMTSGDKLGIEVDFDPQSTTQMNGAGGATSGYLPGVVLGSLTPQVAVAQPQFTSYTVTPATCIYNIQKG